MSDKNHGHGGKREGAGRPEIDNKKVTLSLRVSPDVKAWLFEQSESAGSIIEGEIRRLMDKKS